MNIIFIENLKHIFIKNFIIIHTNCLLLSFISIYIFFIYVLNEIFYEIIDFIFFFKNKNKIKFQQKNIIVYRFENKNQNGPYHSKDKILEVESNEKNPSPYIDFKREWLYVKYTNQILDFKFAFESMEQLNKWFDKETINLLKDNGYFITEYRTNFYIISDYQVLFKKL